MAGSVTATLSAFVPDYTPTWIDGFVAIIAAFELFTNLSGESSGWEWPWVAAGFALCLFLAGPIAKSSVGRFAGDWFREVGISGRVIVIVLFAIGLYSLFSLFSIPSGPVTNGANGIFLWVLVFVPFQFIYVNLFQEKIRHDI